MSNSYLIHNAVIINEGRRFLGYVSLEGGLIKEIHEGPCHLIAFFEDNDYIVIDAEGGFLIPGAIDDQVHFREPGLTHKADIHSESRAAVAGGITSFMDMPNTVPQTITRERLLEKHSIAAEHSLANFSFFPGATNDNIDELLAMDPALIPGVKVFLGASTGNMLVDQDTALEGIFAKLRVPIAIHSESEPLIKTNQEAARAQYGDDIPLHLHPQIRSDIACYASTMKAVALAKKHNTRLHVLHVSTARELELFDNVPLSPEKRITAEVCVHHLWFDDRDYEQFGARIKWNPAVKTSHDRLALLHGLATDLLDVVGTDHAPHTLEEKQQPYLKCPSGGPSVQHALPLMLELSRMGYFPVETVVKKMCHNVADLYGIQKRGYIRKDYHADLVIIQPDCEYTIEKPHLLYKCAWSPWEGQTLHARISHTFVNGHLVFNKGAFDEEYRGRPLNYIHHA